MSEGSGAQAEVVPESCVGSKPLGRSTFGVSIADLAVVLVCLTFVVVYDQATVERWTPRIALVVLVAPVGVVALVRRALTLERAAMLAIALGVWALITGLMSRAPFNSVFGSLGREQSVLIFVAGLGCWALGRSLSTRGRELLVNAVLLGVAVNVLVAVLQVVLQPTSGAFALLDGRPTGLSYNPVYFAGLTVAAAAYFAYRWSTSETMWSLAGYLVCGIATALSGSRVAVLALLGAAVVATGVVRSLRSVAIVPAALLAVACAELVHAVTNSDSGAAARLSEGGISYRVQNWGFGLRAWLDRPIQGYGIGRYRGASQRYYNDEWVNFTGGNEEQASWLDAHNYLVQILVTLGIVGLVLLVWFVVSAVRRTTGPAAWMAAAIVFTWLLQPAVIQTYIVAAFLLGAAGSGVDTKPLSRLRPIASLATGFALLIGMLLSVSLLVADRALPEMAAEQPMSTPGRLWIFARDPVVASSMVDAVYDVTNLDPAQEDYILTWTQRAAEREPDYPLWWSQLGVRRLIFDDVVGARAAGEAAVALQPNYPLGWQVLGIVGERTGDVELVRKSDEVLCRLDAWRWAASDQCP